MGKKRQKTTPAQRAELRVVAEKIDAHLRRLEKAGVMTAPGTMSKPRPRFYRACARYEAGRVWVLYLAYQGGSFLNYDEAVKYLAALDAGSEKSHRQALWEGK